MKLFRFVPKRCEGLIDKIYQIWKIEHMYLKNGLKHAIIGLCKM